MTKPLLLRALHGEETDRRPAWIMRQAGRFLPEYSALKQRYTFEEMCADPALACEVTLMPMKRFDFDAAITFADLISLAAGLGVEFRFDPGPIIAKPITTAAEISALVVPDGPSIAPEVAAAQRLIKPELRFASFPVFRPPCSHDGRPRGGSLISFHRGFQGRILLGRDLRFALRHEDALDVVQASRDPGPVDGSQHRPYKHLLKSDATRPVVVGVLVEGGVRVHRHHWGSPRRGASHGLAWRAQQHNCV